MDGKTNKLNIVDVFTCTNSMLTECWNYFVCCRYARQWQREMLKEQIENSSVDGTRQMNARNVALCSFYVYCSDYFEPIITKDCHGVRNIRFSVDYLHLFNWQNAAESIVSTSLHTIPLKLIVLFLNALQNDKWKWHFVVFLIAPIKLLSLSLEITVLG